MARTNIINSLTQGVDMRKNIRFLGVNRLHFAKNLTFDEGEIEVRNSFEYHDVGVQGDFQGVEYITPSMGLSAISYDFEQSKFILAISGQLYDVFIDRCNKPEPAQIIGKCSSKGDVNFVDSENYTVILNQHTNTLWYDGQNLTESKGLDDNSEDVDKQDSSEVLSELPNNATLGYYIHGRNHISVDFQHNGLKPVNSEIWVSDILGKREVDDLCANDILKMSEAVMDNGGGTLFTQSSYGRTVALAKLFTSGSNGEGPLVDFKENAIVFHNTFQFPRLSELSDDGSMIQGWDKKRITETKLEEISAVGRYAVYELPDDIWFRSEYGFHYLRKTLGRGTVNDVRRNHQSHDVAPLLDECHSLENVPVGYWINGDRLFGGVNINIDGYTQGFVVLNQANTYTEDNTPIPTWEGYWQPTNGITSVHKFVKCGNKPSLKDYGFVYSDSEKNIGVAKILKQKDGSDYKDSEGTAIPWSLETGAFLFSGQRYVDSLKYGNFDITVSQSTKFVKVYVQTDRHNEWKLWQEFDYSKIDCDTLISDSLKSPSKLISDGSWFRFKIEGEGYFKIENFEVETIQLEKKKEGTSVKTKLPQTKYTDYYA